MTIFNLFTSRVSVSTGIVCISVSWQGMWQGAIHYHMPCQDTLVMNGREPTLSALWDELRIAVQDQVHMYK